MIPSGKRKRALPCVLLATLATPALSQEYPSKPIRIIVGFTAGGPNDTIARIVGQKLSANVGVPVTVDNRPGANSIIGTQLAATAAPDGYTMAMISASATIIPGIYDNVPYDITRDFSYVTILASGVYTLVAHPSLPVKTVRDVVALAKQKAGQLNYASSGVGGTLHLAGELFKSMTGTKITHVAYKGGAPAATALVTGEVELMFAPLGLALPHANTKRLRAVAVTSAQRWPATPDLPTIAESGFPGYDVTGWYGLVAPARTPPATVLRLNQEIRKLIALPDIRQRLAAFYLVPAGTTPEAMAQTIKTEVATWAKVVRDAGLSPSKLRGL